MKSNFILIVLLLPVILLGFDVMGSNEFSARFASEGKEFLENTFDFRLFMPSGFYSGLTYMVAHPSDLNPITGIDSTAEGITRRFLGYDNGLFSVEVGNFYTSLGNGILLDCANWKELKLDHNLDGVKIAFRPPNSSISLFSGRAGWDRLSNIKGANAEYRMGIVDVGGSYMTYKLEDYKEELASGRAGFDVSSLNVSGEYAQRHPLSGESGNATYLTLNWDFLSSNLFVEYKRYKRMLFRTAQARYNNPPWGLREPEWFLLAREVYLIDYDNEEGIRGALYFPIMRGFYGTIDIAYSGVCSELDRIKDYYFELQRDFMDGEARFIIDYQAREFDATTGVLYLNPYITTNLSLETTVELSRVDKADESEYNYHSSVELTWRGWLSCGFSLTDIEGASGAMGSLGFVLPKGGDINLLFGKYPVGSSVQVVCAEVLPHLRVWSYL